MLTTSHNCIFRKVIFVSMLATAVTACGGGGGGGVTLDTALPQAAFEGGNELVVADVSVPSNFALGLGVQGGGESLGPILEAEDFVVVDFTQVEGEQLNVCGSESEICFVDGPDAGGNFTVQTTLPLDVARAVGVNLASVNPGFTGILLAPLVADTDPLDGPIIIDGLSNAAVNELIGRIGTGPDSNVPGFFDIDELASSGLVNPLAIDLIEGTRAGVGAVLAGNPALDDSVVDLATLEGFVEAVVGSNINAAFSSGLAATFIPAVEQFPRPPL